MTATALPTARARDVNSPVPLVEITVPVYNEEAVLETSVRRLHEYLRRHLSMRWQIVIADNASTDRTLEIAEDLATELTGVSVLHLEEKGRGRALRAVWQRSRADIVAYMDIDLSTKLDALPPMLAALVSGHSQVATGSRLLAGSRVRRRLYREVLSRGYNQLLRWVFAARFRDAQCGFKAMPTEVAQHLLPLVEDQEWFFDTELLLVAETLGMRVLEIPVDWEEDTDSRVDVPRTVLQDLKGIVRVVGRELRSPVRAELPREDRELGGQLGRFAVVGAISTLAYAVLYLLLTPMLGVFSANAVALVWCTAGNVWANRRFTFGRRGPANRVRETAESWALAVFAILLSDLALRWLHSMVATPTVLTQLVTAIAATGVVTLLRFLVLRRWVFNPDRWL
ncbi:glycosyltransferase [Pseudonocardiaceae bacterium YIM PH 21723]|nr:glycosyltransferase [Pseudonocardiaceae bacterium YIM PH 21723]